MMHGPEKSDLAKAPGNATISRAVVLKGAPAPFFDIKEDCNCGVNLLDAHWH
jgi:hypothetical protein